MRELIQNEKFQVMSDPSELKILVFLNLKDNMLTVDRILEWNGKGGFNSIQQ